jgi:hypothetical protein
MRWLHGAAGFALAFAAPHVLAGVPDQGGPYNVSVLAGGVGVERDLNAPALVAAGSSFSFSAWVRPELAQDGTVTLLALGTAGADCRCLVLTDGRLGYQSGGATLASRERLAPGRWTHVALSSEGDQAVLYVNGRRVARGRIAAVATPARIGVASVVGAGASLRHFGGRMAEATLHDAALSSAEVTALAGDRPNFDVVHFWHVNQGWEWQNRANTGLWRPQDPWLLPQGRGETTAPVAKPFEARPALEAGDPGRWTINGWTLAAAPEVTADGATLSQPGSPAGTWRAATVPGTVLTTLVDRGVYPDPYYGLNNLEIPESLARQDYWYRTSFTAPAEAAGRRHTLVLNGVNYASEVWFNGEKVGSTRGAFVRGQFEVTLKSGANVVAIQISPAPHPGTPHEQSIRGGVGENGGQLAIDGPTFVATEGWDWIPGIRDRNTGLWQNVELVSHGDVRVVDPQVITDLPLPRTDSADIHINVPVENEADAPRTVTIRAAFDDVAVEKTVTVPPGRSIVAFAPSEFAALRVANPRLWWPNGYGDPALHDLTVTATVGGQASDTALTRFGIREVSYDLSLFAQNGELRRVNVQTTDGGLAGERLIDVTHEGIKQSPRGWAESLTPAGEASPAVVAIDEALPEPHLTIRVNGVRIAARGGNWGMDDAMKRVSRERLEPYFRLQRDAHMNIIRNWMGNNYQDSFLDLADEYGMMILSDFWQSTQNFQVEPQDPQLFLDNARDTVARYRNHPSIILWFGRNEGVPYPMLNEGLDDVVAELDGTRWFTGSSNTVNLQGSGPYNYRPPEGYFTDLATGFSVETGTPSLSTLESIQSYVPAEDLWPLSDTLAYHDWHFAGNGDTATFMAALDTMFGAATSFEDFERKAQMMNLETHKAMYEGFLGHLWTKNSGRLLWMTHPAWPSNAWQIYSWDYDTSAAYYGARTATEPLHVQMNLPDNGVVVLNTTREDHRSLKVTTRILSLDNRELFTRTDAVDALANRVTRVGETPLAAILETERAALVVLQLVDGQGRVLSDNRYWRGATPADYRRLNDLSATPVTVSLGAARVEGDERVATAELANAGSTPSLNVKLTLVDGQGERILPAYYGDNYVTLLPGERRRIDIRYPATATGTPSVRLRGWNAQPASATAQ